MKITQITVSYGETQSLPEYSNFKPALTLTATLDADEGAAVAEAALWQLAKQAVHAQVDLALEANGKAAKYDPAPRYQIMRTYWDRYDRPRDEPEPPKIVIVLPNEIELKDRFDTHFVHAGYPESRSLRYAHALRMAEKEARDLGANLIDCSDGDLSRLSAALPISTTEEQANAAMDQLERDLEEESAYADDSEEDL